MLLVDSDSQAGEAVSLATNTYNGRILYLKSLTLSHFRNYGQSRLAIDHRPVVLTGRNGAGKTNILEAISLLTPGRGLRRAKLSEMDYHPLPNPPPFGEREFLVPSPACGGGLGRGNSWAISAQTHGIQGDVKIGTGRDPEMDDADKRIVKIDGKITKSHAELAKHLAIIWLTPQMEQLFQESASAARKFLDRLVYSFEPEHASRVNEYEFAMRERNKLLALGRTDPAWLDALELTMAETGTAIAAARLLTCDHINHAIQRSPLTFPKAHISIHGMMEEGLKSGQTAIAVEDACKTALAANRRQDSASGRALLGAHRSEMHVIHMEKHMPAEQCSTGEQKAMLLSIIMAQAQAGAHWHGVIPILLLDEVIAHLDATRRLELFEEICQIGAQTWMTGTDASLFEQLQGNAQYFKVDNGSIF